MADKQSRICIIGGGFGGLFTALDLADSGDVTLISPEDHFLFTPLLYEYLSGEVEAWQIAPRYKELIGDNVRFIRGAAKSVDLDKREIEVEGRDKRIGYDVLVLAVGGVTNYYNIEGAQQYALPFREMAHADALRNRMVQTLDRIAPDTPPDEAKRAATFALVGGGASGVELGTKMADLLHDAFRRRGLKGEARVLIIEMEDKVVPGMDDGLRSYVTDALKDKHVEVRTKTKLLRVAESKITIESDGKQEEIETAAVVWTAGVKVNPLIDALDLPKNKKGLIKVEPTLQAKGRAEVFALGDIAHFENADKPLDGTAQLAYQEAGLAADNIRAFLRGEKLKTKHFDDLGEAVSLGTDRAAFHVTATNQTFGGALARDARLAAYTGRLPTWHHRLKVGASWFFEGAKPRPLGLTAAQVTK